MTAEDEEGSCDEDNDFAPVSSQQAADLCEKKCLVSRCVARSATLFYFILFYNLTRGCLPLQTLCTL